MNHRDDSASVGRRQQLLSDVAASSDSVVPEHVSRAPESTTARSADADESVRALLPPFLRTMQRYPLPE